MRILIVHNLLWAHYKATVFQALQHLVDTRPSQARRGFAGPGVELNVLQIARNERSRAGLEKQADQETPVYQYNYTLLFDRFLEDTTVRERATALLRQAKAFRPDVINLTGYYDPAQILLLLWAKLNGVRVVMQIESTAADHQRRGLKERFKQWVFSQCDGFFCFGSQSANYLLQLGVPERKILLRKNAVDNDVLADNYQQALATRQIRQQQLGLRPNNFIFVGRLIGFKNLPTLLQSFADARQQSSQSSDWGLLILGEGEELASLTAQRDALDLTKAVTFLPGQPWFRVPELLALSNVLVLPSTSEPWGLVVNEAMACGLPVIVSDRCGCVADLVDNGKTGFVFDPAQPDQLTYHLRQFMDGQVDVAKLSRAAKERIAHYSPAAVAGEMLAGFMKITS
ncbi:glycosyltransferase family 1 protein [Spirosoma sp. KUDC1026]|uniref:glycosyltransferase family 1 protein n=1 Tax=Spirosoma sp. KUDC1026 TaxID=2745947 RepID=UPI00159BB4E8|nr:glycosyltransferase family 1 protein [Spirosoma sp. KUDC1026]QKZ13638.1 glycosyltransferase family 1 protein [Spirosoma sp. KUDC1026]